MTVPSPHEDHWLGFFGEVVYEKHQPTGNWFLDMIIPHSEIRFSTVGWVTPDTLPFEPCYLETCRNIVV